MASNYGKPPQDKQNSALNSEKNNSSEFITFDEFMSICFEQKLLHVIYEAGQQKNCDVEIRFEKDGTPKIYHVKKKRVDR